MDEWGGAGNGRATAPFATFYHLHARCFAAWELERSAARSVRHDGGRS